MNPAITLDHVLAIGFTSAHTWAPDSRRIAFIYDDGGRYSLRVVDADAGLITDASEGTDPVTAFVWRPDGRLAYIQGGRILVATPVSAGAGAEWSRLTVYAGPAATALATSPRGHVLAFAADGRLWTLDLDGPTLREMSVPGRVIAVGHAPAIDWSPDGTAIAATFESEGRWDLAVVADDGRLLWRSETDNLEGPFTWMRPGRLLFARPSVPHTQREWHLLDVASGTTRLLHTEDEPDGLGADFRAQAHPDAVHAILVLRHDGWWHLYSLDTETGHLQTLTGGTGEDVGHAYDLPRVSPDGREIVFSTSRLNLGMRHLFSVDLDTGALRPVVSAPGTSVEAEWSPDGRRMAFKHSTVHHAPEIWLAGRDGDHMRRLVGVMPAGIDTARLALPQLVKTPGAQGWEIPGYLLAPRDLDLNRRYPALVYVHGGGMRQMREGFNPLESYAFFYAVSLWLADRGMVTYMVNYRGGIGYGKTFEQGNSGALGSVECDDCVLAGEYVKALPYVDPARVGIWGLSYGGWLTLAALCKSPETFALGVNIAGIWDFPAWMAWAKRHYRPAWDYFLGRATGSRDQAAEVWHNASPRHWVGQMRAPLVNLHGTKDAAVPFEQMDMIVTDCVNHAKVFETHYYPGESHLFTHRATWRDALLKVEDALCRYLDWTPDR
jgi:dipeptidyl aminopeptidase/acylaminoacyl peptidase